MTPEEYDKEIQSLRNQIASLEAQIKYNNNEISQHNSNIKKDNNCKGLIGNNKTRCQGVNDWRRDQIAMYNSSNTTLRNQIASLEAQIDDLIEARAKAALTANEVSIILANQGKTEKFLDQVAKSEGEARMITAQAQAQAISKDAEVTAQNKKKLGFLIAGIGLVLAVVIGVIIYKKYKK